MTKPVTLSYENLGALPADVIVPEYDRSSLTPGIVHIGLGNFHRGHQAWYLHRLMQEGLAHDWAIVGAGVRPYDDHMRKKLKSQDFLTTLIELDPNRSNVEIVGSMIDYVPIVEGNGPLIAQIADPAIRIVSLTVTEGGYFVDPATGGFDASSPDIQHDAANPTKPRTAFGAIIAALRARRDTGSGPITLQSCDNLQGNGAILRQTVVSLAHMSDPELAAWIDDTCSFPNSMVDCIVPATRDAEIALAQELGVQDAAPVTHESFRQWVIEDDFAAGRPEWERVGATISNRVDDFEAMKIRILNGGHQLLANAGEMLSLETIADCMAHPQVGEFFFKVARTEIAPHVDAVPGMTPEAYVDLIGRRFKNPKIVDTTRRVAFDGSSRHTGFLLPSLRDALAHETPFGGLVLAEALWARMCAGVRENGNTIEANDPMWDKLHSVAKKARFDPGVWISQKNLYGDLANNDAFADAFSKSLTVIWQNGTEAALKAFLS